MDLLFGNTYSIDKKLFKELNFNTFNNLNHEEQYYIGQFDLEDTSYIRLWVTCYPAQFWEAEIFEAQTQTKTIIETGSGALTDFWHTFLGIAKGMIVIKSVEKVVLNVL